MSKDPVKTKLEADFPLVQADEDALRLDRWIKRHYPGVTHGQLQKWLRKGEIRVNKKRVSASFRLETGQMIRLPPQLRHDDSFKSATKRPPTKHPIQNIDKLKSWVLYEDDDVIVLNKPAGLAVQGGTGLKENLDDSLMALSIDGETRPKLVHRLDKETSGVLLIARNDFAAARLAASFRSRKTKKLYWAITKGVPEQPDGEIEAPLVKHGQRVHIATDDDIDQAKKSLTIYQVVESALKRMAFVALWPITGRTHQLRVHMAALGTPILGDPLYDSLKEEENPHTAETHDFSALDLGKCLHLHARQIIIPHPRGGTIDVTAPLSPALQKTWRCMGFPDNAIVDFEDLN